MLEKVILQIDIEKYLFTNFHPQINGQIKIFSQITK